MHSFCEIIVTTLRNRQGVYIDHGFCVNIELVSKELSNKLVHKLSLSRSKDVFTQRNIIDTLELIIRQKEAQLGIHNDNAARSDNTSTTKEAT